MDEGVEARVDSVVWMGGELSCLDNSVKGKDARGSLRRQANVQLDR